MGAYALTLLFISILITLDENMPMNLKWKVPNNSGHSKVSVYIDISHHGGVKGVIRCETSDDGEMDVPASLLKKLKALGVFGFPKIVFSFILNISLSTSKFKNK